VKKLKYFQNLNALKTVGYKEIFKYLKGEYSLERAIELIKQNSRRYAKRQITWFKKYQNVKWVTNETAIENIL
jgi:tRNA dimethylallyltransferase